MATLFHRCLSRIPSVPKLAVDTFGLHNAALHYHAHEATQLCFLQRSLYIILYRSSLPAGLLIAHAVSELHQRRRVLQQKSKALDDQEVTSPTNNSPSSDLSYATSYFDTKDLNQLSRRRKSIPRGKLQEVDNDISSIADAINSDAPLDFAQLRSLRKLISFEIESITQELKGTTSLTQNDYPKNLTLRDFYGYVPLPTVVYELEYPRQESINWNYVAEKTAATFGVIGVMIVVSTAFIYPVVASVVEMKEEGMSLKDRCKEIPWVFSDLLFPFFMEYILSWYVIWECVVSSPHIFSRMSSSVALNSSLDSLTS